MQISPSNPSTIDSIYVSVELTDGGFYNTYTSYIENSADSIRIVEQWCHDCYFAILWFQTKSYTIAPLAAGTYQLTFDIDRLEDMEQGCFGTILCTSDEHYTISFTVSDIVAIEEFNSSNTLIYPNPSPGLTMIQSESRMDAIFVRDLKGSVLKTYKPNSEQIQIDLSDLSDGLYFIECLFDNGRRRSQRLVIQH